MTNLLEIGELIRKTRKEKKLSQPELAQRADVSRNTIDAIENARAPEAGIVLLLRIMHALDLDLHPGTYNSGRPTLEQLHREEQETGNAPRMG
jgi:transcriptional regulator with XRE-family HTH domain